MKAAVVILLLMTLNIYADSQKLFSEGCELYNQKKYEEALQKFSEIEATGEISPELFYNIGNAHFRRGRLGFAIAYFEKAALLNPSDEDIRQNIIFTRGLVKEKQEEVPVIAPLEWWMKTASLLSYSGWVYAALFLLYPLSLFLILRYFYGRAGLSNLAAVGVILALMFITVNLAYTRAHWIDAVNYGVIIQNSVTVLSSPAEDGNQLFKTAEGVKVRVEDTVEAWVKLKMPDGRTGWIKKDQIMVI